MKISQVEVLCVFRSAGEIFVRSIIDESSTWRNVDGEAHEVEVGPQGAVFCADRLGDLYIRVGKLQCDALTYFLMSFIY